MAGRMLWMVLMNCFMKRGVDGDVAVFCCCFCNEEDNSEEDSDGGGGDDVVSAMVDFLLDAVSFTLHALLLWIIE